MSFKLNAEKHICLPSREMLSHCQWINKRNPASIHVKELNAHILWASHPEAVQISATKKDKYVSPESCFHLFRNLG
jgi:hypothetical protein